MPPQSWATTQASPRVEQIKQSLLTTPRWLDVERARLSSLRPEFADKSVILLQTATGSGKTSLLAQWRKEALQTGAMLIEINPQTTPISHYVTYMLTGLAGEILPKLVNLAWPDSAAPRSPEIFT